MPAWYDELADLQLIADRLRLPVPEVAKPEYARWAAFARAARLAERGATEDRKKHAAHKG